MNISLEKYNDMTLEEVIHFLENITYDEAKIFLSRYVYEHMLIFERLEGAQKIIGNGHHIAQYFSEKAVKILKENWRNKEETEC